MPRCTSLADNRIDDAGARALGAGLRVNLGLMNLMYGASCIPTHPCPALMESRFSLESNRLNSSGIVQLGADLQYNTVLTELGCVAASVLVAWLAP